MKLDVLVFAAHPDDAELSMGGTIAKLTKAGLKVGIIDLTQGELGTRGSKIIRKNEAEKAAKLLGIAIRDNLKIKDGFVKFNDVDLKKIITKIRTHHPKYVFAPFSNDRHPDHIGASQLVKEAMFFSGLTKIKTKANGKTQTAYRPQKLFYYMQTYEFKPSFIIDITDTFETKMNSIWAYDTQFHNPKSREPETFISQPIFIQFVEARAKYFGFKIGRAFGEPFFCEEEIELDLESIIKRD